MGQGIPRFVEVRVERSSGAVPGLSGFAPFGVGRVLDRGGSSEMPPGTSLVIARLADGDEGRAMLAEGDYALVPGGVEADTALMAAPLALCLWVWRTLGLELGEAAIFTDGSPLAELIGRVAAWQGAMPVIRVSADGGAVRSTPGQTTVDAHGDAAMRDIVAAVCDKPGTAAVDLSGRPDIIDLLLESLPARGRLMIAGRVRQPLTIDFYRNVHLKGASIAFSPLEPCAVFDDERGAVRLLPNAFRLLEKEGVTRTLLDELSG